jgi:hypothetical protein
MRTLCCFACRWCLGLFQSAAVFSQDTAGQLLARINKLAPEKRRDLLAEKAKAEGEVTFYSSMSVVQIATLSKAFSNRYPFIKVNTYRSSGERAIAKIQTELQAKRNAADIINISAAQGRSHKGVRRTGPLTIRPSGSSFPTGLQRQGRLFYFVLYHSNCFGLQHEIGKAQRGAEKL